jgi:eukaryotic-like serine/threonine-protein kinase
MHTGPPNRVDPASAVLTRAHPPNRQSVPTVRVEIERPDVAVDPRPTEVAGVGSDTVPDFPDQAPAGFRPGDQFLGFTLVEQLGMGGFAQVFLAEQTALAGRRVVLKISPVRTSEPERLGRLQHPNVVPIHSVHTHGRYELICMPFLGRRTLADALAEREPGAADVPAALRLLADLAAGLDHAHRRGILHLDIKPANVLLAETGEPMLFDFNLSHETGGTRELVGGTIPYMAPEQLRELVLRRRVPVDERTDLYAFGLVAYELLTGDRAFPDVPNRRSDLVRALANRQKPVPSARAKNPAVPPAVAAIVQKLLVPTPAGRYASVAEFKADLDRQLVDPPRPAARDRAARPRRRNSGSASLLAFAGIIALTFGLGWLWHGRDVAARESAAVVRAHALHQSLQTLRVDLAAPGDARTRARGCAEAEARLAAFGLPGNMHWRDRPAFADLQDDREAAVAADLGELLLLLAHARWTDRGAEDTAAAHLPLVELAVGCFEPDNVPPFAAALRARMTGEPTPTAESKTSRDHFLDAVALLAAGRFRAAVEPLTRVIAVDPGHGAAHFALGYCRQQLGEFARALERYDTAHALLPHDPRPVFNRGLVFGTQKKHALAEAEFTRAIEIDPTHGEAYRNRGIARLRQGREKWAAAEEDLTTALEKGVAPITVYQLRAQARALLQDARGAEADRQAAAAYEPQTEADYLARGKLRLPADPAGALADFEAAARIHPGALLPLQNQAHVHSEYRNDSTAALTFVTRAVELYPEYAPARAGRALLLARLGMRDAAHRDAAHARTLSDDPAITYQLAGVYAQTSTTHPADADRAIDLLRRAIGDGFRDRRTVEVDPDLDAVRRRPEFVDLVKVLKDLDGVAAR